MKYDQETVNRSGITVVKAIENALADRTSTTISFDHQPYRLTDLYSDARAFASTLSTYVEKDERVAIMARNGRAALLGWWAANLCGAILVPINTANTGEILRHQLRDSDPVVGIVEAEFVDEFVQTLRDVTSSPKLLIVSGADCDPRTLPVPGKLLEEALIEGDREFAGPEVHPRQTSHLIYTAGTTGPSKACIVSHSYICNMAIQMVANLQRKSEESVWTPLPLFHLAAVAHVTGTLLIGGCISIASRFSVSRFWEDIERSGVSIAALMGSMIPMLAEAPGTDAQLSTRGRLQTVSGSPVSNEVAKIWTQRFGVERVGAGAYGMTEAALITASPVGEYRAGTAGKENDSFEVGIVDSEGHQRPRGQVGEIVCRPRKPGIMFDGYWRDPEKTLSVFRDLWFHTGDFGRMDEDGYLFFVDRGKDYLRRGGENISSFELEAILREHPALIEVAVHAVPAELGEDDVKVTAVKSPASRLTEEELYAWAQERIPKYAWPTFIEFRSSLPKNPVGRVLKYSLREEGVTTVTWAAS